MYNKDQIIAIFGLSNIFNFYQSSICFSVIMSGQQNNSGSDNFQQRRRVLGPFQVTNAVSPSEANRRRALAASRYRPLPILNNVPLTNHEEVDLNLRGSVMFPPPREDRGRGNATALPSSGSWHTPQIQPTYEVSRRRSGAFQEANDDTGLSASGSSSPPRRQGDGESDSEVPEDDFVRHATNCFRNDAGVQELSDNMGSRVDWYRWCFVSAYIRNMDRKINRALGRTSERVFND